MITAYFPLGIRTLETGYPTHIHSELGRVTSVKPAVVVPELSGPVVQGKEALPGSPILVACSGLCTHSPRTKVPALQLC